MICYAVWILCSEMRTSLAEAEGLTEYLISQAARKGGLRHLLVLGRLGGCVRTGR